MYETTHQAGSGRPRAPRMTGWYRAFGKRGLDIVLAIATVPVQAAVFAVVAPLIKLEDGGSVFYVAPRRGRGGEPFMMYKYRSMVMNAPDLRSADHSTVNSATDSRQTRIGRVLRKTSVDELPQFFNVLRGDMSVVGPRPNMAGRSMHELSPDERKRVTVRPGITGLAQAFRRNSASAEETIQLDCEYVDRLSLGLDLKILVQTAKSVVARKNIYRE